MWTRLEENDCCNTLPVHRRYCLHRNYKYKYMMTDIYKYRYKHKMTDMYKYTIAHPRK